MLFHIYLPFTEQYSICVKASNGYFYKNKIFVLKKAGKIFLIVLVSLLLLFTITVVFLQTQWGQNWLVKQVTAKLSKDLQSRITIDNINISFFNNLNLQGVLIEDQKKDTLLAAGLIQVRITDWFFFKDKADLKYIGLENAVIKLQRTDSVWNYRFLEQYFSSPGSGSKKKAGITFNLKQIALKNLSFVQKDGWIGNDMIVRVQSFDMDANDISVTNSVIDIPTIDLVKPYFAVHDYTGNRPDSLKPKAKPDESTDSLQWNIADWNVHVGKINVKDGTFKNDRGGLGTTSTYFDGMHVDFNAINGAIKNFRWQKDTILADINLSAKERSGFLINDLKTALRLHPKLMEFNELYLKTNRSVLTNYLAFSYPGIASMSDFIDAVKMDAHFTNAVISSDDIAFFAPAAQTWKKNFKVDGQVKGTVSDLSAKDLTIEAGNNTSINGDVTIVGLPDINSTFINLKANTFRTTYNEAVRLIPAIRKVTTPNLRSLTYLRFKGNYTGFLSDFVAYGTLETNLGTLVTDLNMKLPAKGIPVYSGSIATTGFQLGKFIDNPQLGIVDFKGNLKGKGFEWNNQLDVNIDGTIRRVQYGDYTYQNITTKSRLNKRMFNGDFVIKDPNADLQLTGLIDLRGRQPIFNAHADITNADLKALQLTKENLVLKGIFDLNFTGSTPSNFLGTARIYNAKLLQNGNPLSFDSLVVDSRYVNGIKTLRATSNELDATVSGNFDLETLPDAFTLFLNRYYPSYIRAPRKSVRPQSFSFDVRTGVVEDYIKLVDKRLSGFNNSHIRGSLDIATNSLLVDADVPQFAYAQYEFSDVQLKAEGNFERLKIRGQINNAVVTDSIRFPLTTFNIDAKNDISDISITTTSNQSINAATLSTQVQTFYNGFKLLLNPSSFVLNGKTWNIEQGGALDFRQNTVVSGQVVLRESDQEIRLNTEPSEIGNWNDLKITLSKLNLGDLTPLVVKSNRIEGLLSGEIHIEDPRNRFNVTTDLRADQLRIDNDSIGQVRTSLFYDNKSGLLTGEGSNLDLEHQVLFNLSLDFKDSTNTHRDRITVKPVNYPVKILERFIGSLFSDLQGFVTGELSILGEGINRDYVGKVSLHNAGLKVNFTQVSYKIDDTEIEMKEDGIYFGTMKMRDRFGNTATVHGDIRHKSFSNVYYDVAVDVDSRQMELINTNYNDNQQFYGRAMGSGRFVLVGPQSDMLMNIDIFASATDSSYITLPPSRSSRESGTASFMVEKKYGREMTPEELGSNTTNMTYLINLNANPMVNVDVVLDELTGDIIKGRGSGNLNISAGTSEPLSIRGRYEIEEGSYLFTFQSFFKKPFVLSKGSNNYIEWKGDPYGATIHFDAAYTAEQVNFAPLAQSNLVDAKYTNYRGDVNVVATLSGQLFKPSFTFRIEFPANSQPANDPGIAFGLQQIERNSNELNRQVTYLIVFNSFAPYENTAGASFVGEFASSTISGLLFGEVNKRLNQLLSKVLRNNELTVNFTGSLYNRNLITQSGGFQINQSNLNLTVGRNFFDNRFIVTVGSTFDIPLQANIQQTIQFLPDVTAQWLINKTGSISATFFYRQNLDFLNGSSAGTGLVTTRTGANVAYRKEFNSAGQSRSKKKRVGIPVVQDATKLN